ncbi:MAG: hypothetical protein CTY19_17905 [Methylomonas sp.]|nr:MAG: hypothetical protein CTY19_17905 [Methylomonas sp.]
MVLRRTEQLEKQCLILKTANANLDKALSEHRQTNSELRQSESRFRLILESAGEGILSLDKNGFCTFVNQSALTMLGYSRDEILGEDFESKLERTGAIEESWLPNPLEDCLNQSNIEIFSRKDGSCFLVECLSYPIELNGLTNNSVLVFRDVTASQMQIRNLAYQASHDPLTGLINRSEFERRLIRVLSSMHSDEKEHVLCFLDLDHFKDINDAYGHAAGDHVLSSFSRLLTSKIRQRDTLARLGGDEFVLLLERTTLDQAYTIANELCASVENMRLSWANGEFSVSVSIGISSLAHADGEFANVLCHADSACYEAKKKGRNQIYAFNYHDNYLESPMLNS